MLWHHGLEYKDEASMVILGMLGFGQWKKLPGCVVIRWSDCAHCTLHSSRGYNTCWGREGGNIVKLFKQRKLKKQVIKQRSALFFFKVIEMPYIPVKFQSGQYSFWGIVCWIASSFCFVFLTFQFPFLLDFSLDFELFNHFQCDQSCWLEKTLLFSPLKLLNVEQTLLVSAIGTGYRTARRVFVLMLGCNGFKWQLCFLWC